MTKAIRRGDGRRAAAFKIKRMGDERRLVLRLGQTGLRVLLYTGTNL